MTGWQVTIQCVSRDHAEALIAWLDVATSRDWPYPDAQLEYVDDEDAS